ncbi:hypothetical protein [Couchioplanes caeruleus]|uniref:Uncharacterized protein n=2 Tax=Couchioplanes caeruleus TaxID=56438 RepID=A0A1K0FXS9_9ACTN|nr:hypothetical protein [Couchioplanes caeruleus]OJF09882.1 hypothetical protein BG844_35065 [Couchioplanes caeruleus subsp. caeruleus]ROP27701.1 hypothetical protein EDD30_0392 [Couchioplanes caeruleus]
MDVYVWLPRPDAGLLHQFIERYVNREDPGDDRLAAFSRVYVENAASDDDRAALADLRRGDALGDGFSLYVKARTHYGAILTITREGAAVLGLSIDDPDGSAHVQLQARALIEHLRAEFASPAGCAGVELAPPHSRQEWEDDGLVQIRVGQLHQKAP